MTLLIASTAPIDSAQYARSVREDTAELASYALSDRASAHSTSPPRRSAQTHLESFFSNGSDTESSTNRETEALRQATIHEVSEPGSPEGGSASDKSPGTSVLTNMLRRSPPSTSPQQQEQSTNKLVEDEDETEASPTEGRLIITSNGVQVDERTPLIAKDPTEHHRHPDWIRGEQDLERQETKRKESWPKLRTVVFWPTGKGLDIARTVLSPKSWDRQVIKHAVVAPVGYLPAVILGLLLNILDALSYGTFKLEG